MKLLHGSLLYRDGRLSGFDAAAVVGAHPSLTKLDDGNLVRHTDFRRVYASVLTDWLGLDATKVLGKGFDKLPLFGRSVRLVSPPRQREAWG